MREPSDGDGSGDKPDPDKADGTVGRQLDIPPTRKQDTAPPVAASPDDAEPRASQLDMKAVPMVYPDDGPLSGALRRLDSLIGRVEQIVLVALLASIVLVASLHAILDRVAHVPLEFKDEVIRGGTFAIALLGAAFATQQARNLSMDLVSRRLSGRARLILKVVLGLFTIFVIALFVRAGFTTVSIQKDAMAQRIAMMVPIGGGLIIFHTLLHVVIDVDYLRRGKLPPERMRSGH